MNTVLWKNFSFYACILFALASLVLPALNTHAGNTTSEPREMTFTNPSEKVEMPADWIKKPVKYEEWAAGADLAVLLDQDFYHIILPLIQRYAKENNMKIAVRESTCGITAGMLADKTVDISGFCCPPGKEDRLPGMKFHTLGIAGEAFLINPANPVGSVTVSQLRNIFRRNIHSWSELKTPSGQPGPVWLIRAIGRLHCSTRPGHWHLLLGEDNLYSLGIKEAESIPDMLSLIADSRGAIGSEELGVVDKFGYTGKVKILKINGYSPTNPADLTSLKYPFYTSYNITTWEGKGVENPKSQGLVKYLMKEVEKLDASGLGFVYSSRLKKAGWKYIGDELVGKPR